MSINRHLRRRLLELVQRGMAGRLAADKLGINHEEAKAILHAAGQKFTR